MEATKGLSNKEIARVVTIIDRKLKSHLSSIFERLQVKDRLHGLDPEPKLSTVMPFLISAAFQSHGHVSACPCQISKS